MKKFKITKGNRVYIVDAKSHIDAISKVKAVKDSSIKDYSPEVYVKELEKLIPEYQRLGDLKSKIRESLVSSGKMDKSKMGPDFKLILNDAKVQQWLKQVRELDKKWNNLLTNLNRFGTNAYKQQSNGSDLDVWLNSLPDSWTISDIKFAVKSESRKYKDSISQWNPGMSEIGLFQISYKRNGVYQSILVRANSEEQAKQKLLNNLNGVDIIGVNSYPSPHFHEPILDSSYKNIRDAYIEEWYENTNENPYMIAKRYGVSVKPIKKRGADVLYRFEGAIDKLNRMHSDGYFMSIDMAGNSIKDGWSGIRSNGVIFNYSDGKYTITHKNGKVETFPGNKFNTVEELFKYIDNIKDSKMKDAPAIIPAQNVPEHIVFRNRVKPEDLVQSLRKSKTDSTFESVAIGNISEIIADFKADFANSKLDRVAVVSHYKEYRRNAEHWRDQVSATVRNKLDEMMRVIPA